MVDKTFRTYTDREHRAMAGLSWGGCQTLIMSGSPGAAASRSLFLTSLNGKQIIVRCEHCKTSHLLLDNHLFTILDHNALVVLTYLLTSEVEALAILGNLQILYLRNTGSCSSYTLWEAPNRFDSQHYNENDTPSNLFEEEIRKSQINEYSRFPKCFCPKCSRFPKCLVKTEEKYTDLSTSLRLSSVYIIYGIFPLCSQSLCERFWHENALFLEKKVRIFYKWLRMR